MTTAGVITEFPTPSNGSLPELIVSGPDGDLWYADAGNSLIGRITTNGVITEFPVPVPFPQISQPVGITVGRDGAIWFTDARNNLIGRLAIEVPAVEVPTLTTSSLVLLGVALAISGFFLIHRS